MYKKFRIELNDQQRQQLQQLLTAAGVSGAANTHARILLKADIAGPAWQDQQISQAFDVSVRTVVRVRKAFCQLGLQQATQRKPQLRAPRKLDGALQAHLVALVCSDPPDGHARWSLHLLKDRLVELGDIDSISHESVRQVLKKTGLSLG